MNCNPKLTLDLAARLLLTRSTIPFVALDLVLRRPRSLQNHIFLPLKRLLLKRVNLFVHYFKDRRAYKTLFGIGEDRSAFTSFKANLVEKSAPRYGPEGRYVLCFGRTLRDFDTFFAAMEQLPYPGAIASPNFRELKAHGARFSRTPDRIPANVEMLADDGTAETMRKLFEQAKLVVVPVLKDSIAASGCSTSLNAMSLGKCVIGTKGPGFSDVFQNGEVLLAPPEDAKALAEVIRRAWEDDALRTETALAGFRYAVTAGGEQDLYQRVIEQIVSWYCGEYKSYPMELKKAG
ncbi:MAG: glycosyltransferase [Acidobacteriaceae bacterium]|nr:glycosyltransferase [Acidobacteriaceae bacterium]